MDANTKEKKNKIFKITKKDILLVIITAVSAIVIGLLLRTYVLVAATVPTGSMLNTIQIDDRILASRVSYVNHDPQRYDVVVFHFPDDEERLFVKRVIGLPGETVEIVNGVVYVTKTDGEIIQLDDSFVTNCVPLGDFGPFNVPEDSYFMLGDNRNRSEDSRFWQNKFVHKDKILGQVKFTYYPEFRIIN